jgi:hypothetical protein
MMMTLVMARPMPSQRYNQLELRRNWPPIVHAADSGGRGPRGPAAGPT